MDIEKIFNEFSSALVVQNQSSIERRFGTIVKRLNSDFYGIDSNTENGLYVGSYGRDTAINGVSDLDLLFLLPPELYAQYENRQGNRQSQLLQDVKDSIAQTYSKSKVRGDGQVVVIEFASDYIEVCPVFSENDGSFTYPDSNNGGRWKKTNPSPESEEIYEFNSQCNGNLINLCRFTRAWKNKCGVKIGGLLIDSLCYNFFLSNPDYKEYCVEQYDVLIKDFFNYLKNLDDNRVYWYAPGSNQHVYKNNSNFKHKAKKAYANVEDAIAKNDSKTVFEIWRKVFGKNFPYPQELKESSYNYNNEEEFIEDKFPVNIRYKLRIDCRVTQAGYRSELLRSIKFLRKNKELLFFISDSDVPKPFDVLWKIKNEGEVAFKRNCIRGEILENRPNQEVRKEKSSFEGAHFAECYIIKNGYCVARDRIDVPISTF